MMGRILSGVTTLLLVVIVGFILASFLNCHHVKREVASFEVRPWKVLSCPFPMGIRNAVPELQKEVGQAAAEINREVGLALGYGQIFTDARFAPKKNATIDIVDGSKEDADPGEVCEPLLFGPGAANGRITVASFTAGISEWRLQTGTVILCVDKHASTKGVLDESMKIRLRDWKFYIKHELMHAIMGANHMRYGCGITCASPHWPYVTKEEKLVIRRHYDGFCLKDPGPRKE